MARVYLEEINAFLASESLNSLTIDTREGNLIKEEISSFQQESGGQLIGVNWDKYRDKLSQFEQAMEKRFSLAGELHSAIVEALELIKNYMGEDLMLDSSRLEEYRKERQTCQNSIDTLTSMMNETTLVEYVDENGTSHLQTSYLYDSSELRNQISYATQTLAELDRIILKIEGLDEVYQKAEAILQSAFSKISSFGTQVEGIIPDSTFHYQRI